MNEEYWLEEVIELNGRITELETEIERLRAALLDAADAVAYWGAYANDYFKDKHDLEGCIAEIKAAALEGKE